MSAWLHIHRSSSAFAAERLRAVRAQLERGETIYLAGISHGCIHNSGVALIEVSRERGPLLICNHEEERFSGNKHTTEYPRHALEALIKTMERLGLGASQIAAWLGTIDVPGAGAMILRTFMEEFPASIGLLLPNAFLAENWTVQQLWDSCGAAFSIGRRLGLDAAVPIIGMAHHDTHAWFSFGTSPFARTAGPVMIAVLDGAGDRGAISLYVAHDGVLRNLRSNDSVFDSLGFFYQMIRTTQGGWTPLSAEGRYMGAAAYGDGDRRTNPFYSSLRQIFSLESDGQVRLNRSLANWQCRGFRKPYTRDLVRILGDPIPSTQMWNPDVVLRVENNDQISSSQERLDKAAATQIVLEDALFHVIDHLIRQTGSDRLVLTGGIALNAVANMRLLERFDETYYRKAFGKSTRLHLWVPPVPGDAGATIGAAYMFAYLAGAGLGGSLEHAFYCGFAPTAADIHAALEHSPDIAWMRVGNAASPEGRNRLADLMAFVTARDGVFAMFQGPAETGPRALGHRSIVANPCNPRIREVLNQKVKYREAIRPLAPMLTLDAAHRFFDLSDGASDANYNAYNYMVLTAQAKPEARRRIPAVVHVDGTGRLQIVRQHTDPMTFAYLNALGRHIGVEVAVNTSFNVAGPIVQTATQALDALRRAKGLDAVLMFADEGPVFAAWQAGGDERFPAWFDGWRAEADANFELTS